MTKWCGWCLFYLLLLLRGLRLERDAYKVEDWRKSWPRVVEVDRKFVCWCKCRWRGEEKQFSPCNVIIAVTLLAELYLTKLHSWTRTDMQCWRRNWPPRWASYPPRVIVQVKLDNSSGASLACLSCWRQDDATNKSVLITSSLTPFSPHSLGHKMDTGLNSVLEASKPASKPTMEASPN